MLLVWSGVMVGAMTTCDPSARTTHVPDMSVRAADGDLRVQYGWDATRVSGVEAVSASWASGLGLLLPQPILQAAVTARANTWVQWLPFRRQHLRMALSASHCRKYPFVIRLARNFRHQFAMQDLVV